MQEQRATRRHPIQLAASFGVAEDPYSDLNPQVLNISSGGFCISSLQKFKVNHPLQIVIQLDDEPVTLNARVAWCQSEKKPSRYKVGVQLTETNGADFKKFYKFYCKQVNKIKPPRQ
jgi:Tfp pilus assembly protein PilZ